MIFMFENLADEKAKLFDNHPGKLLFDGEAEYGRVARSALKSRKRTD
jgi:hypothetical protein